MKRIGLILFGGLVIIGCVDECDLVYQIADENKSELQKVLTYYKDEPLKYKAAKFLVENMLHHYEYASVMEDFKSAIMAEEKVNNLQDSIWMDVYKRAIPSTLENRIWYDAKVITADYLINSIEESFKAWEESPWFSQINFSVFCEYILPYRVRGEPISDWRKCFRDKYAPYIAEAESPEEAFVLIYKKVVSEFRRSGNLYPYEMDVLLIDKIMVGTCADRSVYLTCVLRSLGIPAAYDYVPFWANFTISGHSWVSFYYNDSTFILTPNDLSLEWNGVIDASRFYQKKHNYDIRELPYLVDSVKKVGGVFRSGYKIQKKQIDLVKNSQGEIHKYFRNYFLQDVSDQYALLDSREITTDASKYVYLCNFVAGKKWQPIQIKEVIKGKATFNNLNKNVVYLPSYYSGGDVIAIAPPFYVTEEGVIHEISADTTRKIKVCLRRKHLLTYRWTDRWSLFLGGRFEGSNFSDFKYKDILHEIKELPFGIEKIEFTVPQKYRYIRFIAREDADPNFSEFVFYGKKSLTDMGKYSLVGELLHIPVIPVHLFR